MDAMMIVRRPRHARLHSARLFLTALADSQKPPCIGCEFFNDCKKNERACIDYYSYVTEFKIDNKRIRSKEIYKASLVEHGRERISRFIKIINLAQESGSTAIFYNNEKHRLFAYKNFASRYKLFQKKPHLRIIGFFGPEFSKQEIANYLEQGLSQCLN